MAVEQYNPKQTTTLASPNKEIAKQAKEQVSKAKNNGALNSETPAKIGFLSLG